MNFSRLLTSQASLHSGRSATSIASASIRPPARFGGPDEVEWLKTSCVPARRTAPRHRWRDYKHGTPTGVKTYESFILLSACRDEQSRSMVE